MMGNDFVRHDLRFFLPFQWLFLLRQRRLWCASPAWPPLWAQRSSPPSAYHISCLEPKHQRPSAISISISQTDVLTSISLLLFCFWSNVNQSYTVYVKENWNMSWQTIWPWTGLQVDLWQWPYAFLSPELLQVQSEDKWTWNVWLRIAGPEFRQI